MDNNTPPSTLYHHHRAPRTPESYFNVPESIALLNIVKSERIQNAFQSNRKNHASVWEMVAEVLNRYSVRKRSAKQCCNRYENLKKIYTQLKKNPERHVRRNWPYMFLFKEIEDQRGECWGSNNKRMALINKTHNGLSYYHRRRQAATEFSALMDKQAQAAVAQQNLLHTMAAQSNDSNTSNATTKLERFIPNHFVETQLGQDSTSTKIINRSSNSVSGVGVQAQISDSTAKNTSALSLSGIEINGNTTNAVNALAVGLSMNALNQSLYAENALAFQTPCTNLADLTNALTSHHNHHHLHLSHQQQSPHMQQQLRQNQYEKQKQQEQGQQEHEQEDEHEHEHSHNQQRKLQLQLQNEQQQHQQQNILQAAHNARANGFLQNNIKESVPTAVDYEKDCNGALNLQTNENNISLKSEPLSDGEFNPDDIQLMQTNYNGSHNFYTTQIGTNILHPDVIVDTDDLSDCSSIHDCGDDSVNDIGLVNRIDCIDTDGSPKSKRKLSTSTDDGDSTNYELIEYLKRRERRDEQMLKRMEVREDRLLNLLERAVQAIEAMIHKNCSTNSNINNNISNNCHNNNSNGYNMKTVNAVNNDMSKLKQKLLNGENSSNSCTNNNSNTSNGGIIPDNNWKRNKCVENINVKS